MKKLKTNANLALYKTGLLKKLRFLIIPNLLKYIKSAHVITLGSKTIHLVNDRSSHTIINISKQAIIQMR